MSDGFPPKRETKRQNTAKSTASKQDGGRQCWK
jgi:hypothetical protein